MEKSVFLWKKVFFLWKKVFFCRKKDFFRTKLWTNVHRIDCNGHKETRMTFPDRNLQCTYNFLWAYEYLKYIGPREDEWKT